MIASLFGHRRLFLLACGAASACTSSVQPPRSSSPHDDAAFASAAESEREGAGESRARATNPYAPTRLSLPHSYAWKNPKRSACGPRGRDETHSAQTKLSFKGSLAAFPLSRDDDPSATLDTWGAAVEPEASTGAGHNPDFVVASLRPRLRGCFSDWLERRSNAEGSVRFALELGCAGDVQAISAKAEGVDEPTVECLFAVVAPAQFDPPAGGHATLQVPVVFKNAAQ